MHLPPLSRSLLHLFQRFCLLLLAGSLSGCLGHLRTKEQLLGADPASDLVAAPVLSLLSKRHAESFSVNGVRLGDPRSRVLSLWGKPSRENQEAATWEDTNGQSLLHLLWLKLPSRKEAIAIQIDLFPAYRERLHPKNRSLLTLAHIEQPKERQALLGNAFRTQHGRLAKRFFYDRYGWGFLFFSHLLPSSQQIPFVVRLYHRSVAALLRRK